MAGLALGEIQFFGLGIEVFKAVAECYAVGSEEIDDFAVIATNFKRNS